MVGGDGGGGSGLEEGDWAGTVLTRSSELPISCWATVTCTWVRALSTISSVQIIISISNINIVSAAPAIIISTICGGQQVLFCYAYIDFTEDDVDHAADDDDEVKDVPGVPEVALHTEEAP